jgi:hypothetical protein
MVVIVVAPVDVMKLTGADDGCQCSLVQAFIVVLAAEQVAPIMTAGV